MFRVGKLRKRQFAILAVALGILAAAEWSVVIPFWACNQQHEYQNKNATYCADNDCGNCDFWWHYSGAWVAIFTVVLTVSTIGLWWVTERTLGHAQADAARQAKDMEASLAIAKQAADAAVAAQRPWLDIEIEILSPMTFTENGPTIRLGFVIKNIGNTPATNVQFWPFILPEIPEQEITSIEAAMTMARDWAEKLAPIEFGLFVYPGRAPRQEQTHEVFKDVFGVGIADWTKQPRVALVMAIVMIYKFVGGTGRTECAFQFLRHAGDTENHLFNATEGPVAATDIICERRALWDRGN